MKKGREWHFNILFLLFSTPTYLTFTNYHHLHRWHVAAFPKENFDNFGSTPWFHSPFPVLQVEAGKVGLEWNPQAADRTWVGGRSVGKCRGEKCRYPGYRPPPRTHTLASHWKGQSWLLISIMAINHSDWTSTIWLGSLAYLNPNVPISIPLKTTCTQYQRSTSHGSLLVTCTRAA